MKKILEWQKFFELFGKYSFSTVTLEKIKLILLHYLSADIYFCPWINVLQGLIVIPPLKQVIELIYMLSRDTTFPSHLPSDFLWGKSWLWVYRKMWYAPKLYSSQYISCELSIGITHGTGQHLLLSSLAKTHNFILVRTHLFTRPKSIFHLIKISSGLTWNSQNRDAIHHHVLYSQALISNRKSVSQKFPFAQATDNAFKNKHPARPLILGAARYFFLQCAIYF